MTPQRLKSFEEVKDEAAKKLRETQERTLLAKKGQELVDKLRSGETLGDLALKFGVEIVQSAPLKRSSKIDNLPLPAGTAIRDLCPSGGGYGPPAQRDPAARERDEADGLV